MPKKKKRTAKVAAAHSPESQLHKHKHHLIGAAMGAAIGSFIGILIADDPETVTKAIVDNASKIREAMQAAVEKNGPSQDDPHAKDDWLKSGRAAAVWHAAPHDEKGHAFAFALDALPGWSACGNVFLQQVLYLTASKGRCTACEQALRDAGYDLSDPDKPRPPASKSRSKTSSARSRKSKTKKTDA
jgi:hypothetical protein